MVQMSLDQDWLLGIAIEAGEAIMDVYECSADIQVESKDDASPLTQADLAAHTVIISGLREMDSDTPVVSEEGREGDPCDSEFSWLVDPLDGTKEFIKRNGMFTVNIALMRKKGPKWEPIFGVVHAPTTRTTWLGGVGHPAEKISDSGRARINVNKKPATKVRLVASGSHRTYRDEEFARDIGPHDLVRMGSSLKACAVADGSADLYPRFGPTSCWDIAAAHAVVESAGGFVMGPDCQNLDYDLVDDVLNPFFMVASSSRWNRVWYENQG